MHRALGAEQHHAAIADALVRAIAEAGLSPRERQVFLDRVRGIPKETTLKEFAISPNTYKSHARSIIRKLNTILPPAFTLDESALSLLRQAYARALDHAGVLEGRVVAREGAPSSRAVSKRVSPPKGAASRGSASRTAR